MDHCSARGMHLVAEYVDACASGMEEGRTQFQKMIERACDDDKPYDIIVAHSSSRRFRDALGLEMYVRHLAKQGVRLISTTQEPGEDPAQVLLNATARAPRWIASRRAMRQKPHHRGYSLSQGLDAVIYREDRGR